MSLLRIIVGTQLVSEIDTIYKVIVGADELWDLELFGNVFTENRARSTRISSSYSRAAAFSQY